MFDPLSFNSHPQAFDQLLSIILFTKGMTESSGAEKHNIELKDIFQLLTLCFLSRR